MPRPLNGTVSLVSELIEALQNRSIGVDGFPKRSGVAQVYLQRLSPFRAIVNTRKPLERVAKELVTVRRGNQGILFRGG